MSKRRWVFIILTAILLLLTACSFGGRGHTQERYIAIPGSANPGARKGARRRTGR